MRMLKHSYWGIMVMILLYHLKSGAWIFHPLESLMWLAAKSLLMMTILISRFNLPESNVPGLKCATIIFQANSWDAQKRKQRKTSASREFMSAECILMAVTFSKEKKTMSGWTFKDLKILKSVIVFPFLQMYINILRPGMGKSWIIPCGTPRELNRSTHISFRVMMI